MKNLATDEHRQTRINMDNKIIIRLDFWSFLVRECPCLSVARKFGDV